MSEAGHRVLPHEPSAFGKAADAPAAGADTMRPATPQVAAPRVRPADPDAMARLAVSMVPPPPRPGVVFCARSSTSGCSSRSSSSGSASAFSDCASIRSSM